MYQRRTLVASAVGLHARPAGLVAKTAAGQPAKVRIAKIVGGVAGEPVDAASVLGLMTLGAGHGDEVELTADGDAAQVSVDALAELIARDLDA
ncbi:MAG TPA: HPr family phosphocarrier protein [Amycolatopsis sp.]|uniref:HPr family phosphocarrier protein n=1 Tax=Amycolatopsis nalaikhensis TaxID=715472 RepID=A0ABY8XHW9_9PSEU|nr:HPr family phosphocarrier protein [Amycolatopsis sp. 2-2]WIV55195.1 HPr family phosphocarrier protein [Amycolatopsis sp. 2-2]